METVRAAAFASAFLLTACGTSHVGPADASAADAGAPDAGWDSGHVADAGTDAASIDAGSMDAGPTDAGPPECPPTHGDCDGLWENGCEVDLRTDAAHCGACGRACESAETCSAGLCDQERVVQVSAGPSHACIIRASGALQCWGDNRFGQLGDGTTTDRSTPTLAMPAASRVTISDWSTCALDYSLDAWCWGDGANGVLGEGLEPMGGSLLPRRVALAGPLDDLSMNGAPTCGAACAVAAGTVTCWGAPGCGVSTDEMPFSLPRPLASPTGVTSVVIGGMHACALRADGEVWCWGRNDVGQLGRGTTTTAEQPPAAIVDVDDAVRVGETGSTHTCAVRAAGHLACWGENDRGQLGDLTTTDRSRPVTPATPPGVAFTRVATGYGATCAIDTTGQVWCWGGNDIGQLADGTRVDDPSARRVDGLEDAVEIESGFGPTCVIHATGALSCWGLVAGELEARLRPHTVIGLR